MMKEYKTIITHNGIFHADECFAIAFLFMCMGTDNINILRVNKVPEELPEDTIVVDIGGGEFDHHGTKPEYRIYDEHKYYFASFGKVVRKFWDQIFVDWKEYRRFDKSFICKIDSYDCGDRSFTNEISVLFNEMNPKWDENLTEEERFNVFMDAVKYAMNILKIKLSKIRADGRAAYLIEQAKENEENHTIIFDRYVPYIGRLNPGTEYVIFPSDREPGTYNLTVMKDREGNYIRSLPQEWWGYNREGNPPVEGLLFCHVSGFMCVFDSIENAKKAINYVQNL